MVAQRLNVWRNVFLNDGPALFSWLSISAVERNQRGKKQPCPSSLIASTFDLCRN